jgi:hypothetical protein
VAADTRRYPVLARIAQAVEPARWAEDPTRALLVVMRRAVATLPNETADDCADGRTWQRLGELLYFGSEIDSSLCSYDDYHTAARKYSGCTWSDRSFGRLTRRVRERLAEILLDMERRAIAASEHVQAEAEDVAGTAWSATRIPFIPRAGLTRRFLDTWKAPADEQGWPIKERICLVGDAGTGKTRFIREILAGFTPAWISAEADETMLPAMTDLLANYSEDTSGLTESSLIKREFGRLLTRPDGPSLAVIDGIPDPAMLDKFIPRATRTRLVITSRRLPPKNWSPVVKVGSMEDVEAQEMIGMLLPDASEKDCQSLAIMMGHLPLLIEHACAFLHQAGMTDVQSFCTAVSQDVTAALSAITDTTDRALTAVYRRYVEQLSHEAPASLQLLEFLPFIAHLNVPPEYLMAYLLGVPYIKRDQLVRAELAYEAAIRPLEACSLLTVDKRLGVAMRPFVQNVLRRIFADRIFAIFIRAKQLLGIDEADLYSEGWSALTVVGRETCNRVLFTHAKDSVLQGGTLQREGTIGGVQWGMLVGQLWIRHMKLGSLGLILHGGLPLLKDGRLDWDTFLEGAAGRSQMQINEMHGVKEMYELLIPSQEDGAEPEDAESASAGELAERIIEAMLTMARRYQDSSVGQLDFKIVNTWAFDSSEEDELRSLLREKASRWFNDEDEGRESHTHLSDARTLRY